MATSCPKCGSGLEKLDDERVQCSQCNARYRIRRPEAAANPYAPPVQSPQASVGSFGLPPIPLASDNAPPSVFSATPVGVGKPCVNHPGVPAVSRCRECRAAICTTCDFAFPGGVHLCPKCATSASKQLPPKRKTLVGIAYALAVWCTLGTALVFSGAFANSITNQSDLEAFGAAIGYLVMLPSLIGCALGFACLDKRLGNPPVVIVATIWNTILLALWLVMTVIGLAS